MCWVLDGVFGARRVRAMSVCVCACAHLRVCVHLRARVSVRKRVPLRAHVRVIVPSDLFIGLHRRVRVCAAALCAPSRCTAAACGI